MYNKTMCGRYSITTTPKELIQRFGLPSSTPAVPPRYNIAPGQLAPLVIADPDRHLTMMKWGLIPSWATANTTYKPINARCESLATKPMFRQALAARRCLVPADGFFEWTRKPTTKGKVPFRFVRKDRRPFAMAGLWETWTNPQTGEPLATFTLITTSANPLVSAFHDRMPVILSLEGEIIWLKQGPLTSENLASILTPYMADDFEAYQVSVLVNSSSEDAPLCIQPIL